MERVKKWFIHQRKTSGGSMESLNLRPLQDSPHLTQPQPTQSNYELTAIKIKHLIEKEQFLKVVDTLRELSRDFVLNCLESFPFIALNRTVPKSFLIWETLLTKLHNSEEGYIPQFPYKACDELVMNIAWMLEKGADEELTHSCKRVLKCVYMQYNEVLEHLYKEHDRVEYALYTLGLHSPLGTDRSAHTIEQAIKEEVRACLEDYRTALERLDDFNQGEMISLSEDNRKISPVGFEKEKDGDFPFLDVFSAPSPNQVQLHERLYQNQRVFTTLQPSRRSGTLHQLLELLNERIHGDKEVISIFGKIRDREHSLKDSMPVQPWLRKYQHALDLVIGTLKEIEKDLEITIPRVESPMQLCNSSTESEETPQIVPTTYHPRIRSYESDKSSYLQHRHSVAPILTLPLTGEQERTKVNIPKRNLSVPHTHHRPRSTSPQKLLRVNVSGGGLALKTDSVKSMYSSDSSSNGVGNLGNENGDSSSIHDLHSTLDQAPSLAFMRVQSLKTHNSVQVVAGKRKMGVAILPKSYTNLLSMSTGSMNGAGQKHKKSLQRSDSGELTQPQVVGGGSDLLFQQTLDVKNNELIATRKLVQDLRKRERELTDRLSEQAQRHLQDSEMFEDILMGSNRPTLVIQRYKELYSQGRVEAFDAIEGVRTELAGQRGRKTDMPRNSFGIQVVLDVLKLCYAEASCSLDQLHRQWKETLSTSSHEEGRAALRQLESAVTLYLRRISSKHDVAHIIQNVCAQLSLKYSDSDVLRKTLKTEAFSTYTSECAQVCWDLCVQTPPMIINCSEREFNSDLHSRFYESDCNSTAILLYHWPTLLQSNAGLISRGVVQT